MRGWAIWSLALRRNRRVAVDPLAEALASLVEDGRRFTLHADLQVWLHATKHLRNPRVVQADRHRARQPSRQTRRTLLSVAPILLGDFAKVLLDAGERLLDTVHVIFRALDVAAALREISHPAH